MINNYIFLDKNNDKVEIESDKIFIRLKNSLIDILDQKYRQIKYIPIFDYSGHGEKIFYEIKIDKEIYEFKLTLIKVTSNIYCEIEAIVKNNHQAIKVLENIDETIYSSQNFENNYIIIHSYDSISEYYCNKIYPSINNFERLLRQLMLNIYTINFKKNYFEETIPSKIKEEIKERIGRVSKKDKEKIRNQQFFYFLELNNIKDILFTKTWNSFDEQEKNNFLNTSFEILSKEEIKKQVEKMGPKSDWERFFYNKEINIDFKELLEKIRLLRNDVAHCKIFHKESYKDMNEYLILAIQNIKKAIKITENKDFVEQHEKYIKSINVDFIRIVEESITKLTQISELLD